MLRALIAILVAAFSSPAFAQTAGQREAVALFYLSAKNPDALAAIPQQKQPDGRRVDRRISRAIPPTAAVAGRVNDASGAPASLRNWAEARGAVIAAEFGQLALPQKPFIQWGSSLGPMAGAR
jgi:hypothetical protein